MLLLASVPITRVPGTRFPIVRFLPCRVSRTQEGRLALTGSGPHLRERARGDRMGARHACTIDGPDGDAGGGGGGRRALGGSACQEPDGDRDVPGCHRRCGDLASGRRPVRSAAASSMRSVASPATSGTQVTLPALHDLARRECETAVARGMQSRPPRAGTLSLDEFQVGVKPILDNDARLRRPAGRTHGHGVPLVVVRARELHLLHHGHRRALGPERQPALSRRRRRPWSARPGRHGS